MTSLPVLQRQAQWLGKVVTQQGYNTLRVVHAEPLTEVMSIFRSRSCNGTQCSFSQGRTVTSTASSGTDEAAQSRTSTATRSGTRTEARSSAKPLETLAPTTGTTGQRPSFVPGPRSSPVHVDTLSMMKQYEDLGLSRTQAEALTRVVTDVLRRNIDMLADTYVSAAALEMSELRAESSISGFRAEVMKIQELQEATSVREMERLQANLDKVKSEIRYEVDKLTASQRLDLNLEKGRMRDELQSLRDKSNELEIKVDKEVNSLKAAMEQSKNDTVKYMLGVVMALITAGLGAARLFI